MKIINIIITGADAALVSAFIESASEIPVINPNKKFSANFPYPEMKLGRLNIDQSEYLYLVGTPLEDDYKIIWQRAAKDLAGMVIIINPGDPKKEIEKAKTLIKTLASHSLTYLVVFNDVKKAAEEKKLREKLKLTSACLQINADVSKADQSKQAILSVLLSYQDKKDDSRLKSA